LNGFLCFFFFNQYPKIILDAVVAVVVGR